MKKVYTIENLDCANCAARIEAKFNAHPQVKEASITFSTRQLRLEAEDPDALIPELQAIARTVESGAQIHARERCGQEHPHGQKRPVEYAGGAEKNVYGAGLFSRCLYGA